MSKNTNTLLSFLVGAATGAILGILYAPDKGKNTRDKLSYRLDKYRENLKELVNDLVDGKEKPFSKAKTKGEKVINDTKDKAERLLGDVEEFIGKISTKK